MGFPLRLNACLQLLLRQAAPADGTAAPVVSRRGRDAWSPLLTAAAASTPHAAVQAPSRRCRARRRCAATRGRSCASLRRCDAREGGAGEVAEQDARQFLAHWRCLARACCTCPVRRCRAAFGSARSSRRGTTPSCTRTTRELAAYHRAYTRMMRFWHSAAVLPRWTSTTSASSAAWTKCCEGIEFVGILDAARLQQTPRPGALGSDGEPCSRCESARTTAPSMDGGRTKPNCAAPPRARGGEGEGGGGGGDGAGGGEEVVGDVEEPTPAVVVEATTPTRLSWSQPECAACLRSNARDDSPVGHGDRCFFSHIRCETPTTLTQM